jgi:hypothetical protein
MEELHFSSNKQGFKLFGGGLERGKGRDEGKSKMKKRDFKLPFIFLPG